MESTERTPAAAFTTGVFAPVADEIDAWDLEVIGAIPPELSGRYLRNGPNPLPGERAGHWFVGPGMLHGVRLESGRARWYRNRWIDTATSQDGAIQGPPIQGPDGRDLRRNSANTHVIEHGGSLLALCEGGLPYQVTADLETVGAHDFSGRLRTAMTAHPKTDPGTGELYFYGYSVTEPYLTFHVADRDGTLIASTPVEVSGPTMMHDFAITEHYVIWLDLPVVFQPNSGRSMPFGWQEEYGARIGIMSRDAGRGESAAVWWFDIDPCYVFHVGNAREDEHGRVLLDAVRYDGAGFGAIWNSIGGGTGRGHGNLVANARLSSTLHRWVLDPRQATVTGYAVDDREIEFPSINDEHVGRTSRYLYAVSGARTGGVVKYDTDTGSAVEHRFSDPRHVGEAVFVPAISTGDSHTAGQEDAGWLLSITTPVNGDPSELVIMDAADLVAGPVARVRLPRRVPAGFHGSWIPENEERQAETERNGRRPR